MLNMTSIYLMLMLFDINSKLQLLNEVRGPITYNVVDERGDPPNKEFVTAAEVGGRTLTGSGKNKKDSKRNCALHILKELHQIEYPQYPQ